MGAGVLCRGTRLSKATARLMSCRYFFAWSVIDGLPCLLYRFEEDTDP